MSIIFQIEILDTKATELRKFIIWYIAVKNKICKCKSTHTENLQFANCHVATIGHH